MSNVEGLAVPMTSRGSRRASPRAQIPYRWSDAWLLLSIILAASAEGATLERIISIGDGINRAIFTFQELDGGLARLYAGGLVRLQDERVFPTESAQQLYERVSRRGGSMLGQMKKLQQKLGASEPSASDDPNHADPEWSLQFFSEADLRRAYAVYKAHFDAVLRKLEQQGD